DEKVRQFNKRFYEEFRRSARRDGGATAPDSSAGGGGSSGNGGGSSSPSSGGGGGGDRAHVQLRPKMRSTARTDTTVTLEWSNLPTLPVTTAYELSWRQRGRGVCNWSVSPTLIVGNNCRKKNLEPAVCYEFRIRAASAWGWSGYSDAVMVVTLPAGGGGGGGGGAAGGSRA
ncbi:unnamed protein product, partial [Phaeothamnion confervicola]